MNAADSIKTTALPVKITTASERLAAAPRRCAGIVLFVGCLVSVGWIFQIDVFRRIISGYVVMNPTTAAAFILAGIALNLLSGENNRTRKIGLSLAAAVTLIGFIKICAFAGIFDLGIDRIFFAGDFIDPATGQPNRMAPNTAINFLLSGAALLLLNVKNKRVRFFPAQYPAIAVLLNSFLSLVGYLYGAKSFYVIVSYNPMAIHTAVSFLILSLGLLLSKPQQGLIKEIFSPLIGGQGARRLFPLVVFVPLFLGWLQIKGEQSGFFTVELGFALLIVAISVILGFLVIYSASLTNKTAGKLVQTEDALNTNTKLLNLLSESEARYRQLADAMPQIVWTAQPDGFLDYYNQRWFDYTGMTLEQTKGWGWKPVLHPDDVRNCVNVWTHAVETGGNYQVEYRFKRAADGEYRWHLGQALPVRDAENRIVKWFGSCTDIHELKKVEEELRQIREELETRVGLRTAELVRANTELKNEIAERKRTEEKLVQLSSIVESSDDAIVSKNLNGVILSWNRGAERLYGYAAEEVSGKNISLLVPPGREDEEPDIIEKIKRGESVEYYETVKMRKDGSLTDVSLTISPIRNAAGEITGAAKIARDITERKRAEDELRDFAAKLERSNSELQDFASVASHDLQEPLRKVQAFGDRLKTNCGDALSEEGRVYLERMQGAASRMQILINDLLTFSRVESKAQPFVPVNMRGIAIEVLTDLESIVGETNATIEIGELATIEADPTQMRQLLQNLVGNALKFHRPDVPPVVKISGRVCPNAAAQKDDLSREKSATEIYCLTVEDNGIGFEEKYVGKIFKVFQRLHGRSEYEGTGIGLAVCRKIAERHGGAIKAQSVFGAGSTFTVELPINHSEKNQQKD